VLAGFWEVEAQETELAADLFLRRTYCGQEESEEGQVDEEGFEEEEEKVAIWPDRAAILRQRGLAANGLRRERAAGAQVLAALNFAPQ
jgi:hypothetical protein